MNLKPLKITAPDDSSTGSVQIVCCVTKARESWNKAARAGWKADLHGQSFNAYYSPEALAKQESK